MLRLNWFRSLIDFIVLFLLFACLGAVLTGWIMAETHDGLYVPFPDIAQAAEPQRRSLPANPGQRDYKEVIEENRLEISGLRIRIGRVEKDNEQIGRELEAIRISREGILNRLASIETDLGNINWLLRAVAAAVLAQLVAQTWGVMQRRTSGGRR